MAKTPWGQLSPAVKARYNREAARLGTTGRRLHGGKTPALQEARQRARGHGAHVPSRAQRGGATESEARRFREESRALGGGRMTSAEVQRVRRWFRRQAKRTGYSAAEAERTYKAALGELKQLPFADFERIRDNVGRTDDMFFEYGEPGATGQQAAAAVNRQFIDYWNDELGINLDPTLLWFITYKPGAPDSHIKEAA